MNVNLHTHEHFDYAERYLREVSCLSGGLPCISLTVYLYNEHDIISYSRLSRERMVPLLANIVSVLQHSRLKFFHRRTNWNSIKMLLHDSWMYVCTLFLCYIYIYIRWILQCTVADWSRFYHSCMRWHPLCTYPFNEGQKYCLQLIHWNDIVLNQKFLIFFLLLFIPIW